MKQINKKKRTLTIKEAATYMSIGVSTLRRIISKGKIKIIRHSEKGNIFVLSESIDDYLSSIEQTINEKGQENESPTF